MSEYSLSPFPSLEQGGWNVICDFDGTISPFDVTDAVLSEFADPAWEAVEALWLDGTITARQCMREQIDLLRVRPADLDAFLDTIPLTDGFSEFAQFCRASETDILVVSDGMDYAIKRVLAGRALGDIPVIANRLSFHGDDGCKLLFPYGAPGCPSGVCKCEVAKACGGRILLIGDSHSDICLAGTAGFVLAKRDKPLHRHCLDKGIPHRPYDDFYDVLEAFSSRLQPGRNESRVQPCLSAPNNT